MGVIIMGGGEGLVTLKSSQNTMEIVERVIALFEAFGI